MVRGKRRRPIWTLDCETDPFEHGRVPEPFLWGVYDGENHDYWEFETREGLVDFLADKKVLVYAHNGGKFDYHYLREWINEDETISVISGRLARFRIGNCEFRDSLNLFAHTKLADFQKMEIDYRLMKKNERDKPENRALIRRYLRSDCENLYALVSGFLGSYGPQFTQAGAAMKYWSKHYGHVAPKSTAAFYDSYHPFYFGGRVQCFAHGHKREDFNVMDINSAYPRAMVEQHPYSCHAVVSDRLPPAGRIGPALIELDAVARGCFPLRAPDGSLFFPEDENTIRTYYVTGWELLAGFETDSVRVHRIRRVHDFSEIVSFAPYVHHFYGLRKQAKEVGDRAHDIFAKVFLNALYGKFAANPTRYQEFVLASDKQILNWKIAGYIDAGFWGGHRFMVRPLPEKRHRYYNIATAASITGYVRADLWKSLNKVSGALYCDTDAIAARDTSRLPLGDELGEWKLEAECDEYAIAGKKNYAFHKRGEPYVLDGERKEWEKSWKIASKGAQLTPREMIRVASGEKVMALNRVPNYSMHRDEIRFIDREIRSTYRDISRYHDEERQAA